MLSVSLHMPKIRGCVKYDELNLRHKPYIFLSQSLTTFMLKYYDSFLSTIMLLDSLFFFNYYKQNVFDEQFLEYRKYIVTVLTSIVPSPNVLLFSSRCQHDSNIDFTELITFFECLQLWQVFFSTRIIRHNDVITL